jgi:hypothetical protein
MQYINKHINYIINIHLIERLYINLNSHVNHLNISSLRKSLVPFEGEIEMNCKLEEKYFSLITVSSILFERITGSRVTLKHSNSIIPDFNLKLGTVVGISSKFHHYNLYYFLLLLCNQSFYKTNKVFSLLYSTNNVDNNFLSIKFGLNKLLFFSILDSCSTDWDEFSYLFDEMIYGISISVKFHWKDFYIARLILSSYGFQ